MILMKGKLNLPQVETVRKASIRILYITNPESIHARRWVKAFADRDYDVHILSPVPWREAGVTTHAMPLYPHRAQSALSRSLKGLKNVREARRLIKRLSPEILHLHGLFTVAGPDLMFVTLRQRNLIVSTWGSDIIFEPGEKEPLKSILIKRFIFRQAAAVLATSRYQSRVTQKYCPVYRRVITTPFGVDLELFRRNGKRWKTPGIITLGFVKRLEVNYGPHILMEAFGIVERKHKNTRLLIIGEGSMKQILEERLGQLGLKEKAVFAGYIENHLIPKFLNEMDIFVMPSLYETFGVAAVEAQAVELPVVASNIEGIREVVIHNKTGLLFEKGDPGALARCLLELIENPEKRKAMGTAGRIFVSERYDWRRNVDKVERIYQTILGSTQ